MSFVSLMAVLFCSNQIVCFWFLSGCWSLCLSHKTRWQGCFMDYKGTTLLVSWSPLMFLCSSYCLVEWHKREDNYSLVCDPLASLYSQVCDSFTRLQSRIHQNGLWGTIAASMEASFIQKEKAPRRHGSALWTAPGLSTALINFYWTAQREMNPT